MRGQAVLIDAILTLAVLLNSTSKIGLNIQQVIDLRLDEQLGLNGEL